MTNEQLCKTFGKRIREIRKFLEMTQKELAKYAKISVSTINRIEQGKYEPSIQAIIKINSVFGIEANDLFYFDRQIGKDILKKHILYLKSKYSKTEWNNFIHLTRCLIKLSEMTD